MGVSETGKSSLGKMLSLQTGWSLYDAGDFHPKSNKDKMNSGLKLNDSDRKPWVDNLSQKISLWSNDGQAILAFSAIKESYREILSPHNNSIQWVVLNGSFAFGFCLNNLL